MAATYEDITSSVSEEDNTTANTINTPPESVANNIAPEVGRIYLIRSVSCGRELSLLNGQVVLAQAGDLSSPYWTCVRNGGWYGFQHLSSGRFLGHDGNKPGGLRCSAKRQLDWEHFHIGPRCGSDGYTLHMKYWSWLQPIGIRMEGEIERLDRLYEEGADGMGWSFIEVP